MRPSVQGTVVVLENKTGRILAMAGGFSYPLSQLNRATQAQRQPGSAIKPLSYLAALQRLQPNTYVSDDPITLPPIGVSGGRSRAGLLDAEELRRRRWRHLDAAPGAGELTQPRDRASARRRHRRHPGSEPRAALRARDGGADLSSECVKYYPFVLGAQPVRPIDLAAFYAAIANEGIRPSPHVVEFDRAQRPDRLSPRSQVSDRDRFRRPRVVLSAQDHDAGRAEPGHRALDRVARALRGGQDRHVRRRRTTPGSSASPTTSRSRSGSATTMPAASGARSAAAPPAAASRSRSSSRSSRRCGRIIRRRRRSRRRRRRPSGRWRARRCVDAEAGEQISTRAAAARRDRVLPHRPHRSDRRHAVPAGVA